MEGSGGSSIGGWVFFRLDERFSFWAALKINTQCNSVYAKVFLKSQAVCREWTHVYIDLKEAGRIGTFLICKGPQPINQKFLRTTGKVVSKKPLNIASHSRWEGEIKINLLFC